MSADTTTAKAELDAGTTIFNISEGAKLKWAYDINTQGFRLYNSAKVTVNGPGTLQIRDKDNASSYTNRGGWNLNGDTWLKLNCPVEVLPSGNNWTRNPHPQLSLDQSTGKLYINNTDTTNTNSIPGPVVFGGGCANTVYFSSISALGGTEGIIFGSFRSDNNRGSIAYDGEASEEFSGYLNFTNAYHFGASAEKLSGTLTLSSEIRTSADGLGEKADFRLYSYPGRVIYNCTLAESGKCPQLIFAGWTDGTNWSSKITADAELPARAMILDGTKLLIEGNGRALPPIVVSNKTSKLYLQDVATNSIPSIVFAANTTDEELQIYAPEGALLKVTNQSSMPTGVLLNGKQASITAKGYVVSGPVTATDMQIGAMGSVVSEGESGVSPVIGITTKGTAGVNTVDNGSAVIAGLAQQSEWPSTLAFNEGEGLSAGFVGIDPLSVALTIGTNTSFGHLSCERLFNYSSSTLTINAPLQANCLKLEGTGDIVLNGGTYGEFYQDDGGNWIYSGYRLTDFTNCLEGVVRFGAGEYVIDSTVKSGSNPLPAVQLNAGRTILGDGVRIVRDDLASGPVSGVPGEDSQFQVGYNGIAVLEIEDGAVVSNRITTCGTEKSGNRAGYPGAVYQKGGTVYNTPAASGTLLFVGGRGYSYGFWGLGGGSLTMDKEVNIGGVCGVGIYQQTDGSFIHSSGTVRMGHNGTGLSEWYQSGGTALVYGMQVPYSTTSGNILSICTIDGTGTVFKVRESGTGGFEIGCHNGLSAAETNMYSYLNVNNGARIVAGVISRNGKHRNHLVPEALWETNEAYVNSDGGIFQFSATWGVNAFGSFKNGATTGVDRVTIYKGGMTIDARHTQDEEGDTVEILVPLRGATGMGVKSVAWVDMPDLNMIGPPIVRIIGDGKAAAAYACFDMEQRKVTEVRVTSPGVDYNWAKAVFQYNSNTATKKVWTNDVVLAENETDGGLRVTGGNVISGGSVVGKNVGKVNFHVQATYVGPTQIDEGGYLQTEIDDAINSASKLILNGGMLNLRKHNQTFSDIETRALTVMGNGKPTIAGLTADVAAAAAGTTKNVNLAQFNFASDAKLTLVNVGSAVLDRTKSYTLVSFSAVPTTLDMSEAQSQVPEGWRLKPTGTSLTLSVKKPTILIMR